MSLLCSSISVGTQKKYVLADEKVVEIYSDESCRIGFKIISVWDSGFEGNFIIENLGENPMEHWEFKIDFNHEITSIWDGEIVQHENNTYIIGYPTWNSKILVGSKAVVGFIAKKGSKIENPGNCENLSGTSNVNNKDYTITYKTISDWMNGFNGEISITNNTKQSIDGWQLEFNFDSEILNFWTVDLLEHEKNHYKIKGQEWNSVIKSGETIKIGFEGKSKDLLKEPYNYVLTKWSDENSFIPQGEECKDSDGDYLNDKEEKEYYKTDPKKSDTDGDGVKDGDEVYILGTDPLLKDTNGDGISDGDEDFDHDGITNSKELNFGSNPFSEDSDLDGLSDHDEYFVYHTSLITDDTDGDGLPDFDEIELNLDPNNPDSNHNGVKDGEDKIYQTLDILLDKESPIFKAELKVNAIGDINTRSSMDAVGYYDRLFGDLKGLIGEPIDININTVFDNASIVFYYNKSKLKGINEDDLGVLWYNEEEKCYELMDNVLLNKEEQTITVKTTHFSEYAVVSKSQWDSIWNTRQDYSDKAIYSKKSSVVFVIDNSKSVKGEQLNQVKESVKKAIDKLYNKDEACIISYNTKGVVVQDFTNNKQKLINAVNSISSYNKAKGIIEKESGFKLAIKELQKTSTKAKAIILISDDNIDYQDSTLQAAKENRIRVFPMTIKSAINEKSKMLAKKTIGEYYISKTSKKLNYYIKDIIYLLQDGISTLDSDNDGLYDVFEVEGMLIANGNLLYSNPEVKDTDNDGLSDFLEMTSVLTANKKSGVRYIKNSKGERIRIFDCSSYPDNKDSDNDGILDKEDLSGLYHTCMNLKQLEAKGTKSQKDHKFSSSVIEGFYYCSLCKQKIPVPDAEDEKILTNDDLLLMRSLQKTYLITAAEIYGGNKKYYEIELLHLEFKMDEIRNKGIYRNKYSYSDKNGKVILDKKEGSLTFFPKDTKPTKCIPKLVKITSSNKKHYDGTDIKLLLLFAGMFPLAKELKYILFFLDIGVNEGLSVTTGLDFIIDELIKNGNKKYLLRMNRLYTWIGINEDSEESIIQVGDSYILVILDHSYGQTPTAKGHVEQKHFDNYYDKYGKGKGNLVTYFNQ